MVQAAQREGTGAAYVVPILMRSVASWQSTPIGHLEPLPADHKPIGDRSDRDKALGDIAEHITTVVAGIRKNLSNANAAQGNAATSLVHMDPLAAAALVKQKAAVQDFDVFLCYNSQNRAEVKQIGEQLKLYGILPWFDQWNLRPGWPWQRALEEQIDKIKSAAVFVGNDGIGPWQKMEIEGFLQEFIDRRCPVIPVVLSSAPQKPALPRFLRGMTWVDFRTQDPEPMKQLLFGITGNIDYIA